MIKLERDGFAFISALQTGEFLSTGAVLGSNTFCEKSHY